MFGLLLKKLATLLGVTLVTFALGAQLCLPLGMHGWVKGGSWFERFVRAPDTLGSDVSVWSCARPELT